MSLSPDGTRAYAAAQELDRVYRVSVPTRTLIGTIQTPPGAGPDPVIELAR